MQYIDDMPATTSFATKDLSQTCGETPSFQDTRIHGRTHMIHLRFVDSNLFSPQLEASHALSTAPALAGCCRHSERCYVRCSHSRGPSAGRAFACQRPIIMHPCRSLLW